MHILMIPIITASPAAFFISRAHPITVSAASARYFPAIGIKAHIANFAVLLATPSTTAPNEP
jgi:hypothetical protein